IKSIPIAPIAAIAMRLRLVKGRNHDATRKKENATRVIHSAFLIVKSVPELMLTWPPLHGTQAGTGSTVTAKDSSFFEDFGKPHAACGVPGG
ncbi:MAG TPA: hypothetical protein VGW76_18770, partial [Pyrinomonadaceae bacterium]|nr:hypothetical protein [Pyrinomonadaceae bacterium]